MIAGKQPESPAGRDSKAQPIIVLTRSFPALADTVREILILMTERLRLHTTTDLLGRAELVLAELLNNVAQHGRAHSADPAPIVHLSVVAQPDGLACSVSDDGGLLPSICLNSPPPDPRNDPEGGFGWFLIGHLTQSLIYFREGERNYVAFTIPLHPSKAA
ncbi:ATP-binding protein [Paracoccus aurantiacus]|uniref:ATP-binding protein n=1 Tax=Paracoccus aurantiacus TaxID=2599412 RepID=A0A5C6S1L7_9RHOB|nr:ATP-binding protein [Paracoccus aurantiacus]TXB68452.1 ATP-binding protein [Paracoccus aurantiacus]